VTLLENLNKDFETVPRGTVFFWPFHYKTFQNQVTNTVKLLHKIPLQDSNGVKNCFFIGKKCEFS